MGGLCLCRFKTIQACEDGIWDPSELDQRFSLSIQRHLDLGASKLHNAEVKVNKNVRQGAYFAFLDFKVVVGISAQVGKM